MFFPCIVPGMLYCCLSYSCICAYAAVLFYHRLQLHSSLPTLLPPSPTSPKVADAFRPSLEPTTLTVSTTFSRHFPLCLIFLYVCLYACALVSLRFPLHVSLPTPPPQQQQYTNGGRLPTFLETRYALLSMYICVSWYIC